MKSLFEEMGGTYHREGDYLLPDLALPPEDNTAPLGKYGRLRLLYLKERCRALYTGLQLSGKLNKHLHEVDDRANVMVEQIVTAMAKAVGTDEALKASDQLRWIGLMNDYRASAEEIVMREVVYG